MVACLGMPPWEEAEGVPLVAAEVFLAAELVVEEQARWLATEVG